MATEARTDAVESLLRPPCLEEGADVERWGQDMAGELVADAEIEHDTPRAGRPP